MENKRPALPKEKYYEQANQLAFKLAAERIASIADIEGQCHKCGAQYQVKDSRKAVLLRYLSQSYLITLPEVDVLFAESTEKVSIRDKVLIVHYFISAKGTPLTNRLITFRELPEGTVYFPTFCKRTSEPLLNYFGKEPDRLLELTAKLGGYKADYGDVAVTIPAFSRVPITIILWRGDEEFPPRGNVVFDASISDYLPTEDIAVLCEMIAWKLVKIGDSR